MPMRKVLQAQPLGLQQCHHFALSLDPRNRARHPGRQFRPDPEDQPGIGQIARLRGAQLKTMRITALIEQQIRRAGLAHHHGHQRMRHLKIGHHAQILGGERCGHHGAGQGE